MLKTKITKSKVQVLILGNSVQATTALEKLISNVMGVLTIIAIIWFALQIILAGYGLMTAHGDPKRWKKIGLSLPMVFWEFLS